MKALGRLRKSRVRNALLVYQVAVCLVLTIGATFCLRSLLNARSIDPGFETDPLLAQHDCHNRLAVELRFADGRLCGFAREDVRFADSRPRSRFARMRQSMSVPLFPEHLAGILLGVFAALALMLAMPVKYFFRPAISDWRLD